ATQEALGRDRWRALRKPQILLELRFNLRSARPVHFGKTIEQRDCGLLLRTDPADCLQDLGVCLIKLGSIPYWLIMEDSIAEEVDLIAPVAEELQLPGSSRGMGEDLSQEIVPVGCPDLRLVRPIEQSNPEPEG